MRTLIGVGLLIAAGVAQADTYQMTFGWDADPAATSYEARYRVGEAAEATLPPLSAPGGSVTVEADPGAVIRLAVRNVNASGASQWVSATTVAPAAAGQPADPRGIAITIIRTGG